MHGYTPGRPFGFKIDLLVIWSARLGFVEGLTEVLLLHRCPLYYHRTPPYLTLPFFHESQVPPSPYPSPPSSLLVILVYRSFVFIPPQAPPLSQSLNATNLHLPSFFPSQSSTHSLPSLSITHSPSCASLLPPVLSSCTPLPSFFLSQSRAPSLRYHASMHHAPPLFACTPLSASFLLTPPPAPQPSLPPCFCPKLWTRECIGLIPGLIPCFQ